MIVTILAVLKAGAAYVPMDPDYPDNRIKYILNDINANVVICNNTYNDKINKLNIKKVNTIPIDSTAFTKILNTLPFY